MNTRRAFLLLTTTLSLATLAFAQKKVDPDEQEVIKFRLTTDNFNKFSAASTALMKLTHSDPKLREQISDEQQGKTLAQSVSAIERHPNVVAAIRGAGMSTHDYIVMTATLVTSGMVVGMKRDGTIKEIPAMVSAENAAFVDQNYDKIKELLTRMQADNK